MEEAKQIEELTKEINELKEKVEAKDAYIRWLSGEKDKFEKRIEALKEIVNLM